MEQIIVGVADCRIGDAPGQSLVTFALGSCIGLAMYDPEARIGGLLHFLLPDSSLDRARSASNPFLFADTGIQALVERMTQRGAAKHRLVTHAAGASRMIGAGGMFDIGRRNFEAMQRALAGEGLTTREAAIGGSVSRNLRLDIATGRVWLWEGGKGDHAPEAKNTAADRR